jgi:outer membrane protein TolC
MGQMNLKDALIIQQSLVNFKLSYLDTKRDWLVSGVELLRASGYPILEIDIEK